MTGTRGRWLPLLLVGVALTARAGVDREAPPAPAGAQAVLADSVRYAVRVTDNNLIGMTITNYGFYGNNFVSRSPSLEYPLGLGFEHLVRAGLWVGARAVDAVGPFTGVVTGAVDGFDNSATQSATEFTPASTEISARSTLSNSKYFSRSAVSELDLLATFSDQPARTAANVGERHRPIGILVRQDNFMWSFSDYQHVVFFHFTIKNNGTFPLQDAWVGFYSEMASGDKNAYSAWPPRSGGSPLGAWYRKKWIEYQDSLRFADSTVAGHLFREHYCFDLPKPDGCRLGDAPYWVGTKLLGVRPGNLADTADKRVTFAAWDFAPGDASRDEDRERYDIMSAGAVTPIEGNPILQPNSGDPVELLAVGPFREVDPGDSIQVDFAVAGGQEVVDLQAHVRTAQRAYDRNYIVPVPPPSPRLKVVARAHGLDLYWDDSSEQAFDPTSPDPRDFEGYRIYLGDDRLALHRIAQFDLRTPPHDTTGFNTGLDSVKLATPVVIDGTPYQYRYSVSSLRDGFKYFCAVTAYDLGNVEISSLESGISQNKTLAIPAPAPGEAGGRGVTVFPNPYRVEALWDQGKRVRDHYLWFANLPQRCTLKVFTLAGDEVFGSEFNGAEYHGEGARGIYDRRRELDVDPPTLSGTMFGWDLITQSGQAAATGLYLYSVEDHATGKRTVGKFLVVKSDREDF